jgi:hypothetical protein
LAIDFLRRKEPLEIEAMDTVAQDSPDTADAVINENQNKLPTTS